jgi:hypothetical protein
MAEMQEVIRGEGTPRHPRCNLDIIPNQDSSNAVTPLLRLLEAREVQKLEDENGVGRMSISR